MLPDLRPQASISFKAIVFPFKFPLVKAKLVGKNLIDVPDAGGKMVRKEIIDGIQASGTATVDYKYKNPQSGTVENKISYCKKAADLAICAGYYK